MEVEAWLVRAAARAPQRRAIGDLRYEELLEHARAVARRLARAGARAGDRVGVALPAGQAFAETLHGVLLLGAVAVPIDPRLSEADARRRRERCVLTVSAPLEGEQDAAAPLRETHDLEAPAIVVHTSGTSGEPKQVELTYGNWLWSAIGSAAALGCPPDERWLCTLPLSHVGGLSILMRSAIAATSAIVHERFDVDAVLGELRAAEGPTVVSLVPTTLQRLLDAGLQNPPSLRWALLGGAQITPELLARAAAAGVPVAPTYGMTEACSQVVTNGAPLFCTRLRLSDDGEILISGPTVAPGSGPVLRSGDLGALDEHGRLELVGRLDDVIITGGENVAPLEVERVLESHPGVAEAGVHGRHDEQWGEAVIATVVPLAGAAPDAAALRAWCTARLASYQVPKEIVVCDGPLPRTVSGKLQRRLLS